VIEPQKQVPVWNVVHREVLVEILRVATSNDKNTFEEMQHLGQLADQVDAGTLGVLTKERWEGNNSGS
jgi:hypothetical protein